MRVGDRNEGEYRDEVNIRARGLIERNLVQNRKDATEMRANFV